MRPRPRRRARLVLLGLAMFLGGLTAVISDAGAAVEDGGLAAVIVSLALLSATLPRVLMDAWDDERDDTRLPR